MSRVEINAGGRHVIVDHTGDLPYLIEKALDTWRQTSATCLVHRDPPRFP